MKNKEQRQFKIQWLASDGKVHDIPEELAIDYGITVGEIQEMARDGVRIGSDHGTWRVKWLGAKIVKKENELERLTKKQFNLETLEAQNSDSLDFSDQAVWTIKEGMEKAYALGVEHQKNGKIL
jgi:hypothetical protein